MQEKKIFTPVLRYLVIILIVSFPLTILVYQVLSGSDKALKSQIGSQLSLDSQILKDQLDNQFKELINEVKLLPLPIQSQIQVKEQVGNLLRRRPAIHHVNYFSADGNLRFSSTIAKLEWKSNLLNTDWYRQLIIKWRPILSSTHRSPMSPFPKVISLAVPKLVDQKIDGFWLVYLNVEQIDALFPAIESLKEGKFTIWFDGEGNIVKSKTFADSRVNTQSIKDNKWWFKINEVQSEGNDSAPLLLLKSGEVTDSYFYSTIKSEFGNLQVLIVQNEENASALFWSLTKNIIFLAAILQIIFFIVTAVIIHQWEKQKAQLDIVQRQTNDLQNINELLKTKTENLMETNAKLDQLSTELGEQKNNLLQLNYDLERLQKYLNFLTIPVIAINEVFEINFVNRAAEIEFGHQKEKMIGKPVERFLKLENQEEFVQFLDNIKSSLKRDEKDFTIQGKDLARHFILSCDYLILSDWKGFIISMTDLTEMLALQRDIKNHNRFLNQSSNLIQTFLGIKEQSGILNEAIKIINDYAGSEATYFYQMNGKDLKLEAQFPENQKNQYMELPLNNSITGGTLINGQPVVLNGKTALPQNIESVEKKWKFNSAVFKPIIINNKGVGVVVVIDPKPEIVNEYENTLARLLAQFEIGISAQIYRQSLEEKNIELEQNSAYRAQLLRSTTHGLRTPLSTIKGYARLFLLEFGNVFDRNPKLLKYVNRLEQAIDNMAEHLWMYLDIARMNRGDLVFDIREIPTRTFLEPIIDFLKKEASERSVKLKISGLDKLSKNIMIDSKRFIFALKAIFLNALRFAPVEDTVSLNFKAVNNQIIITFEDHGIKIKKEHIPLIGSELLPKELLSERIHYGNNLAIALAANIVRLAKGELSISSATKKTIHKITLPVNE